MIACADHERARRSNAVVFDMEYTAWEGSLERGWNGLNEHREIVQIGAVKLDQELNEIDAISILVRPAINPKLSVYFIHLTGLTQHRLDREGLALGDALERFHTFAGQQDAPLYCNGSDHEVVEENAASTAYITPSPPRNVSTSGNGLHPRWTWLQTYIAGTSCILSGSARARTPMTPSVMPDRLRPACAMAGNSDCNCLPMPARSLHCESLAASLLIGKPESRESPLATSVRLQKLVTAQARR